MVFTPFFVHNYSKDMKEISSFPIKRIELLFPIGYNEKMRSGNGLIRSKE
jgi:hypothetical protein